MRWTKGRSGNPRGRPPRPRPLAAALRALERKRNDAGLTNARALADKLWALALAGDLAAIRLILEYTIGKPAAIQITTQTSDAKTYISISPDDWPDNTEEHQP